MTESVLSSLFRAHPPDHRPCPRPGTSQPPRSTRLPARNEAGCGLSLPVLRPSRLCRRRPTETPQGCGRQTRPAASQAVSSNHLVRPAHTGRVKTEICDQYGIEFPLFAFSHCRDVVAAVTNAGGFGVLGGVAFRPDQLEQELSWIDEHVNGKPYGVDIIVPAKFEGKGENLTRGPTRRPHPGRAPRLHQRIARRARHRGRGTAGRILGPGRRHRQEPARRRAQPPDQDDGQRARRSAGLHDRGRQGAGYPGRRIGRRQRARDQAGAGGRRSDRGAGHRGRRPLRRSHHLGAHPRGARRDRRDPGRQGCSGACRRWHCDRPADGGVRGDGRGRSMDRIGVVDHRRGRDRAVHQTEDAEGFLARHRSFGRAYRKAVAAIAFGLDRRLGAESRKAANRCRCPCRR